MRMSAARALSVQDSQPNFSDPLPQSQTPAELQRPTLSAREPQPNFSDPLPQPQPNFSVFKLLAAIVTLFLERL